MSIDAAEFSPIAFLKENYSVQCRTNKCSNFSTDYDSVFFMHEENIAFSQHIHRNTSFEMPTCPHTLFH